MECEGKLKIVPVPGGLGEHEGIIYPLWDKKGQRATAAMTLYNEVCKKDGCFTAIPQQPDMEVTWKITDDRAPLDSYQKTSCSIHSPHWGERLLKMFFASLPFVDGDLRNPCPYHTTVPIRKLFSAEPKLKELFEGKVVIYGADLLMASDLVDPPTHTALPAAHLHAMAFNNLLDWGNGYRKAKSDGLLGYLPLVCLFLLILVEKYMAPAINDPDIALSKRCKIAIEWIIASLIIIVVYAYIAYEYLNLGVSNWAGLLLLNAGFALIDMRGF